MPATESCTAWEVTDGALAARNGTGKEDKVGRAAALSGCVWSTCRQKGVGKPPAPALLFTPVTRAAHAGTPHVHSQGQRSSCHSGVSSNVFPCALASVLASTRAESNAGPHLRSTAHSWTSQLGLSPPLGPVKVSAVRRGQTTEDRGGARQGAALGARIVGPPQKPERHPPPKLPRPALVIQGERAAVPPASLQSRIGRSWKDGAPHTHPHALGGPNGAPARVVCVPRRVLASTQKICSFWTVVVW